MVDDGKQHHRRSFQSQPYFPSKKSSFASWDDDFGLTTLISHVCLSVCATPPPPTRREEDAAQQQHPPPPSSRETDDDDSFYKSHYTHTHNTTTIGGVLYPLPPSHRPSTNTTNAKIQSYTKSTDV